MLRSLITLMATGSKEAIRLEIAKRQKLVKHYKALLNEKVIQEDFLIKRTVYEDLKHECEVLELLSRRLKDLCRN